MYSTDSNNDTALIVLLARLAAKQVHQLRWSSGSHSSTLVHSSLLSLTFKCHHIHHTE